jgi:hypothetical protein
LLLEAALKGYENGPIIAFSEEMYALFERTSKEKTSKRHKQQQGGTEIDLRDRLSHLSFQEASRLLGLRSGRLISQGGGHNIDITNRVKLDIRRFRLLHLDGSDITIELYPARNRNLRYHFSVCDHPCDHAGAAFSLILEEKLALGLAIPPPDKAPLETLSYE